MPQRAWSPKRERQYEHIKEGLEERGAGEDKAEEIAARTVNKERAWHGEAKTSSRTSIPQLSSKSGRTARWITRDLCKLGGLRSPRSSWCGGEELNLHDLAVTSS